MRGHSVKEARKGRAEEQAVERAKRTPQQQLERLDQMFGEGKGATKERARLAKQLAAAKPKEKPKEKKEKKAIQ